MSRTPQRERPGSLPGPGIRGADRLVAPEAPRAPGTLRPRPDSGPGSGAAQGPGPDRGPVSSRAYPARNGSLRSIVASRPGPSEISSTATPTSASIRST